MPNLIRYEHVRVCGGGGVTMNEKQKNYIGNSEIDN